MEDKDATVLNPGVPGFWTGPFRPDESEQQEAERIEMWRALKATGLRSAANLIETESESGGELSAFVGREHHEAYRSVVQLLRTRATLLDS